MKSDDAYRQFRPAWGDEDPGEDTPVLAITVRRARRWAALRDDIADDFEGWSDRPLRLRERIEDNW